MDRILDTRLWKYYLVATLWRTVKINFIHIYLNINYLELFSLNKECRQIPITNFQIDVSQGFPQPSTMSERECQLASDYEGLLKVDTDLYYFIEDKMLSCRICHSCEQIIFTSLHLKPWGQPTFPLSSYSFFVWCWFSENVAKIIWPCRSLSPAEKSWICNWCACYYH